MGLIVDSSVWVCYFKSNTPLLLKKKIDVVVNDSSVVLCEPVLFELYRAAHLQELKILQDYFSTFSVLETPKDLWEKATQLGQICFSKGFKPSSLDLLIAQIALHYKIPILTFDKHLFAITKISHLKCISI